MSRQIGFCGARGGESCANLCLSLLPILCSLFGSFCILKCPSWNVWTSTAVLKESILHFSSEWHLKYLTCTPCTAQRVLTTLCGAIKGSQRRFIIVGRTIADRHGNANDPEAGWIKVSRGAMNPHGGSSDPRRACHKEPRAIQYWKLSPESFPNNDDIRFQPSVARKLM